MGSRHVVIITIISIAIIGVSFVTISAQQEYVIPSWVKVVAGFWAQDEISDTDFGEGLSFMIDQGIIQVPKIQSLENEINRLETENKNLKGNLAFLEIENSELKSKQGTVISSPTPIPVPSDPTEFNPYNSWEVTSVLNIGGIKVNINQFGFMEPNDEYFGLDMSVTYTRGGNPIELEMQNISIIDENGFVYVTSDSENKKFDGYYIEDRKRRSIMLFDNMSQDFNEIEIVISLNEKDFVDNPNTFTFRYKK